MTACIECPHCEGNGWVDVVTPRVSRSGHGLAIRRVRSALGLSQERFAELLGWSVNAVGRWEAGRTHPPAAAFDHLALMADRAGLGRIALVMRGVR